MRRFALLTALAVLAGCSGDEASSSPVAGTVAVGQLPGTLPPPSTSSTLAPTTTSSTIPPSEDTRLAVELGDWFDATAPPAAPAEGVVDDTGRLHVRVPADWADRRTAPAVVDDGPDAPSVAASPDLSAMLDGYDAPGITVVVVDETPVEALRSYEFSEDCDLMEQGRYDTDLLDGQYRAWRTCGGTGTAIVTVGAETGDGDTVLVLAQVLGATDLAAVDDALESVRVSS